MLSSLFRTSTLTFPRSQLIPCLLFSGSSPSCPAAMWHSASLYFRNPVLTLPPPEPAAWLAASLGICLGTLCAHQAAQEELQPGCDAFKGTKSQGWKSVLRVTEAVKAAWCAVSALLQVPGKPSHGLVFLVKLSSNSCVTTLLLARGREVTGHNQKS